MALALAEKKKKGIQSLIDFLNILVKDSKIKMVFKNISRVFINFSTGKKSE